jgi:hypothetical protein
MAHVVRLVCLGPDWLATLSPGTGANGPEFRFMRRSRKMNHKALIAEARRLRRTICCGYCDQLGGYHQGECIALGKIVWGMEKRVTVIRPFLSHVRRKLAVSI